MTFRTVSQSYLLHQEEYNSRYNSLDERYRQQTERYDQLEAEKQHRLRLRDELKQFIDTLKYSPTL